MSGKLNKHMVRNVAVVIGILIFALITYNKKVEQQPSEMVEGFISELLEIESKTIKNNIQDYFDSVGYKTNSEMYEAAKKSRDVSLLAAESIRSIEMNEDVLAELYQPMNDLKAEITTSYEFLASTHAAILPLAFE